MSRDINPFALRMQPKLRALIEAAAKAHGRSQNSEIVARLEASFEADQDIHAYALEFTKRHVAMEDRLSALEALITELKKSVSKE